MNQRTRTSPAPLTGAETLAVVVVVAVMIGLRFVTRSALWFDEALSANVASLPIGDIPAALMHDGHPPLYYVLLHLWSTVFGEGDVAVRALSGVISVLTLPVAWAVGRRRGGAVGGAALLLVVAVAPYDLRYATETRMYALLMLGVFVAILLVDQLLEAFTWWRAVALTLVTGALLWTHYWTLWLGAVVGVAFVIRTIRSRGAKRAESVRILGCLAGGVVLFLPWLSSMLEQADATGTPWALPASPPRVVEQLVQDLGGGDFPEAIVFSLVFGVLVLIGLFALPARASTTRMEVDVRTVPGVRSEAMVACATLAVGVAAGYLLQSTFAPRYAAVFLPFVFVVAGTGLARMPGVTARSVLAGTLVLVSLGGAYRNVTEERSQGEQIATAIDSGADPDDLVVFCPDQLGPAVNRYLTVDVDRAVFPSFAGPERIDWVDYEARNRNADVDAFTADALDRAGSGDVWLVWGGDYRTLEEACPALVRSFGAERAGSQVVPNGGKAYFEHAALWRFPAPR